MKCLTVLQPWAWAILHAGKSVENRTWRTRHRGPLLIHAGASRRMLADGLDWLARIGVSPPDDFVFSAILGVADLIDCVPAVDVKGNRWACGPWCWVLDRPRPLPSAIPYRGRQMLYDVPVLG